VSGPSFHDWTDRDPEADRLAEEVFRGVQDDIAPATAGGEKRQSGPRTQRGTQQPRGTHSLSLDAGVPLCGLPHGEELLAAIRDPVHCREVVEAYDRCTPWVAHVLPLLGLGGALDLTTGTTRAFAPVSDDLPDGARANLWQSHSGEWIYRLHDAGPETPDALCLAEVYAAAVSGKTRRLRSLTVLSWKVRLLAASGLLELPEVTFPPLPGRATPIQRHVYDGVVLLARVHAAIRPDEGGFPLVRHFLGDWCGVTEWSAFGVTQWLLRERVIVRVGRHRPQRGLPMTLYAPNTERRP
jgi:hypothetical protein